MRKLILTLALILTSIAPQPKGTLLAASETARISERPPAISQPDSAPPAGPFSLYLPNVRSSLPPSVFGVEMHDSNGLTAIAQVGTTWVRRNAVDWSLVEPVRGERNWEALAALEKELRAIVSSGMQVILIVRNTPGWAQKVPGSTCGPVKEEELPAFAAFVHDLVLRYKDEPYRVRFWELENEPDVPVNSLQDPYGCWGDVKDEYYGGKYYAKMLAQVYPQIKAVDPQAQVLVGGLLMDCDPQNPPTPQGSTEPKDCRSSTFLKGILEENGGQYFDGVSFHAYDYYYGSFGKFGNPNWNSSWDKNGSSVLPKTRYLKGLLAEYGLADKFLINTETSLLCSEKCDLEYEATKAFLLSQVFTVSLVEGLKGSIWYDLYGSWRSAGLLYSDNRPRPAYLAYQFARREIGNAIYTRDVSGNGVTGYEFQAKGRLVWVLWSQDGAVHPITLPQKPLAVYDTLGKPAAIQQLITVNVWPIFVEWKP